MKKKYFKKIKIRNNEILELKKELAIVKEELVIVKEELNELKNIHHDPEIDKYFI